MGQAAAKLMEPDEFLQWCLTQEQRWELVDGVPLEMMAGASAVHDRIVSNLIILLGNQLRGSPRWPATSDLAVRTRLRSFRRADVLITCGPPRRDVYDAEAPRMVVEVLSPSNVGVAWERKLREYRRHEALDYILLVDFETVAVTLYQLGETGWDDVDADRLSDSIELPRLSCRLPLVEFYDGTGLEEAPPA